MKDFKKRDIVYLWIIILSFLALVFLLSNTMYLYGSQLDWYSEHISIPEYFRTLFYNTKDLFPDFAFNIGNGQNIYNLSYYGLLSPFIFISYLFPKVSMTTFIMVSTILSVLVSAVLMYIFLKKHGFKSETALVATFIFTMSSSISMHSHRHIMFINYMPFLMLGLYGVDKKFDDNKGWLLTLGTFLMIMTSYYFSIGGICVLIIYAFYRYLNSVNKVTWKSMMNRAFSIILPVFIGVLGASIIILPTFATLLNNRAGSNVSIALKDLLIPSFNTEYLMYDSYGVGLTGIIVLALINYFKKNSGNLFLGIVLSLAVVFPIFNYILNGTMYIDAKTLIPFLPLYIYVLAQFIEDVFDKKINFKVLIPSLMICLVLIILHKYKFGFVILDILVTLGVVLLYFKVSKKTLFIIPVLVISFAVSLGINKWDTLVLKYTAKENESIIKDAIDKITQNDKEFYRIANNFDVSETVDKTYGNIDYYNSTIYSSISNQVYNKFYFDLMNNNIPSRNRALTVTTQNLLYLMLSNNKYLVSRNKPLYGYEEVEKVEGLGIYKNENVLPLGFATSNVISYDDFNKLGNFVKQEALLNMVVADTTTSNDFVSSIEKIEFNWDEILKGDSVTKESDGTYTINVLDSLKISYDLPDELKNKIVLISFKMNNIQSCRDGDLAIKINNSKNKLTCKEWKYYNGNEEFTYVLAETDLSKLIFSFSKGLFNIGDIETYVLDYADIENVKGKIDSFIVDKEKTKGDKIIGHIDVTKDGYFILSVPYDDGFVIKVDGQKYDYEKVDDAFIGFKILKGEHDIEIEYKAPLKKEGLFLSFIGFVAFVGVTLLESRRKI